LCKSAPKDEIILLFRGRLMFTPVVSFVLHHLSILDEPFGKLKGVVV
jgi:hypothetical protein